MARRTKHVAQLLHITPLAVGVPSAWVGIPDGWENLDEPMRREWLSTNYPGWLTAEDDGPLPIVEHRFPLIDANTYQVIGKLRAFEPLKQEATRTRVQELKADPSLLGITAPTPSMLEAIMRMPETLNLIYQKAREDVEPLYAEQEALLRLALHQANELRELRIQAVLEPLQPVFRGIVRALVNDRNTHSSEELDAVRSTAEHFASLSESLRQLCQGPATPEKTALKNLLHPYTPAA